MSEDMSDAKVWKLRCEQLEDQVKRAKEDALKWRRANKKNMERTSDAYQNWEKSDKDMISMLDRIANPINTFEKAQAAAQEIIDFLKKQNGIE
jgi:hypothetical protein